jgi:FkbM family methyltransferase
MRNRLCLKAMAAVLCRRYGCSLRNSRGSFLVIKGDRRIRLAAKHLLYSWDIALHFDVYFSLVVSEMVDGYREVDYSEPRLQQLSNGLKFEISSMPEELPALDSYFRFYKPAAGERVFDIGAYCGIFTYELSKLVGPEGTVIAFEPDPLNVVLLRRNIEFHALKNVTVVQAAVSNQNGTAPFNSDGCLGSALSLSLDRPTTNEVVSVQTLTLEAACQGFGVPTFMKIDAEGAEIEILSGSLRFLSEHPIHFVVDTSHSRGGSTTHRAVETIFAECTYQSESSPDFGGFMTTWASKAPMLR